MNIIDIRTCNSSVGYGGMLTSAMLCAGVWPAGGVDTCQGDSGGPLVTLGASGNYELVGVTSFGIGCAFAMKPGVYADVRRN